MQDKKISYRQFGRNCFQLTEPYRRESRIKTGHPFKLPFMSYDGHGQFIFEPGFCWDGPSDPINPFDPTKSTMRSSLGHDGAYRAMREGLIDADRWRQTADEELRDEGEEDGMLWIRAEAFYIAVEEFGGCCAEGGNPIITAP